MIIIRQKASTQYSISDYRCSLDYNIETDRYGLNRTANISIQFEKRPADSEQLHTAIIAVLHCFILISMCCSAECIALWYV